MDTLELIGSTLGLGFASGIRLYSTVLVLGLGIRFGLFHLAGPMQHLDVLSNTWVLGVAGVAWLMEFFADKVPWVDSIWDSVHTFIRPVGAILLGATALGNTDPALKTMLVLLCGGLAFTGHSSKAATRLAVNHVPEPFSNIGLSLAEDLAVPAGVWVAVQHPYWMLGFLSVFVVLFAWLSPKVFRLIHVEYSAFAALVKKYFGEHPSDAVTMEPVLPADEKLRKALQRVTERMQPMPADYARAAESQAGPLLSQQGLRCAPTRTIRRLRNSMGYLGWTNDSLVFVTKRFFRYRVHRIPLAAIEAADFSTGILLDDLRLRVEGRLQEFDVLKSPAHTVRPAMTLREA